MSLIFFKGIAYSDLLPESLIYWKVNIIYVLIVLDTANIGFVQICEMNYRLHLESIYEASSEW